MVETSGTKLSTLDMFDFERDERVGISLRLEHPAIFSSRRASNAGNVAML